MRLLAERSGLSQHATQELLKQPLEHITQTLQRGDSVVLRDFGSLHVSKRNDQHARAPDQEVAVFRASRSLLQALQQAMAP